MARDDAPAGVLARTLATYLNDPGLLPGSAAAVLRGAFLATFGAQALVAGVVAGVVALTAGRQDAPSGWVSAVVLLGALGQLLLGLAIGAYAVRQTGRAARRLRLGDLTPDADDDESARRVRTGRTAALSSALLSAVLLSTPAWFLAFAWVTGQGPVTLTGVLAVVALGYAFGVLQQGPMASAVTRRPLDAAPGDDEGG